MAHDRRGNLPAEVDVLIIGCGPAGLTLAAQLAAFPEINTRIVEQKSGPLLLGQADGIACRTVEMFHAFGFSERLLKEAYWINETTFWKPDDSPAKQHRPQRQGPGCRRRAIRISARGPEPGARARFLPSGHAQCTEPAGAGLCAARDRSSDRPGSFLGAQHAHPPGNGQTRADRSRARGPGRNREGPLCGRLRRRAQRCAPRASGGRFMEIRPIRPGASWTCWRSPTSPTSA